MIVPTHWPPAYQPAAGFMPTVAALYIMPRSLYRTLPGVDCWDEKRDARLYDGPYPVVAHPPCKSWGRYWRFAGPRPGTDNGTAAHAVAMVRIFGGVLEQPAHSRMWANQAMPRPGDGPDLWGGWSIQVNQVDWGHPCSKPTWLYCVGVTLPPMPPPGTPTHVIDRDRSVIEGRRTQTLPSASRGWRSRTPLAFAEWLVAAARTVPDNRLAPSGFPQSTHTRRLQGWTPQPPAPRM